MISLTFWRLVAFWRPIAFWRFFAADLIEPLPQPARQSSRQVRRLSQKKRRA